MPWSKDAHAFLKEKQVPAPKMQTSDGGYITVHDRTICSGGLAHLGSIPAELLPKCQGGSILGVRPPDLDDAGI